MFTGIVIEQVQVKEIAKKANSLSFSVEFENEKFMNLEEGDSVSLDGVCLTAKNIELNMDLAVTAEFDVSHETLSKTHLKNLQVGAYLNAEPALRMGDSMGGHQVTGHVEGMGVMKTLQKKGDYLDAVVECSGAWAKASQAYVLDKGSITIDGVSLTSNRVEIFPEGFRVFLTLIPETIAKTKWGHYRVGDSVNVETDIFAKTVANILKNMLSQKAQVNLDNTPSPSL